MGCFQLRAVVNEVAVTLGQHFIVGDALILLGKCPGVESLGHNPLMNSQCFPSLPTLPPGGLPTS